MPEPMRVVALIDGPQAVETILRYLGVWHDPPPKPPLHGLPGFSRVGPEWDSGVAPAIGNEPSLGILPVVSADPV